MARQVSDLIGFEAFDTIVTGDMVTDSKPHPEAYLAAASSLGVDVVHCLAVEDSVPGVASAVAAGTVTIGVPHMIPLAQSPLYDLWPTLAGQSVHDLHSVYALRRPVSTSPSKDTTTA
jgi:beta-phosphoglucomutase-like phosphatase (HAD superfamily)